MRKISLIGLAMLIVSIPTFAGDYLTNTNQNAAFLRMIARGASIDVRSEERRVGKECRSRWSPYH